MSNSEEIHQTKLPADPLELFVDPTARRSITRSIYRQLREAIASGRVAAGDRLPPTRELAAQLGVSRHTVTTVYDQLVGEGYLSGRSGGETFVNPASPRGVITRGPSRTAAAIEPTTPRPTLVVPQFDLRPGAPDHRLFPTAEWRRCMLAALQHPPGGYGDPAGLPVLREAIAHWISRSRGLDAAADQIVVTSGAQQAIDLILRLLVEPGDIVAVEEPGYQPVMRLCAAIGADVRPVPVDAEGLVVDQIPARARLVYTTPAHQFPTGVVMSLPRRLALLDRAERHDLIVIEDDYDSEYRHVARPLEPLQRLDRNDRVIYVDTFSKTMSPALRLGFALLPRTITQPFLDLRRLSDWQPAEPVQSAMARFVTDGHLSRHLRRTRKVYSQRHHVVTQFLVHAVEQRWLDGFTPTCAGLHVTATLDRGRDEEAVRSTASGAGVAVGSFAECWLSADPPPGLVIGFGSITADQLPAALQRLAEAC
ncbi:MAG: MocR-like pyridoxine biosynthesis transcription factor PdxR [Ilumatobacteraceae bacterium]